MKIENFKTVNAGSLKATFQVIFPVDAWGSWCVNMTLFKREDGQTWFGYPAREYMSQEGKKKYFKLAYPGRECQLAFEDNLRTALVDQVREAKEILGNVGAKHVDIRSHNSYAQMEVPF